MTNVVITHFVIYFAIFACKVIAADRAAGPAAADAAAAGPGAATATLTAAAGPAGAGAEADEAFVASDAELAAGTIFDITKHGATAGGDVAPALLEAWKAACEATTLSVIVIPKGEWTLSQIKLAGECKAPIHLKIEGTLKANPDVHALPDQKAEWITINYVNDFIISGGGVLDGQGHEGWKQNDCHKNTKCAKLPYNLSLNFLKNVHIKDIETKNSKNFHVNCMSSENVVFRRFKITAPPDHIAPNTDGLHIARSINVQVLDSIIETGDDCVSIGDETDGLKVKNVTCGPGHGISIGSMGKHPEEKDVKGVHVINCKFIGTQNGARIKTWPSAPAVLTISDTKFEDLIMENVSNPIMIDQEYCPHNLCDKSKPSLIQIEKLTIKNIKGTSATKEALILSCSSGKPCKDVVVGDYDMTYTGTEGPITSICNNVQPKFEGKQNPPLCTAAKAEL